MKTIAIVAKRDDPLAVAFAEKLKARYTQLSFVGEAHLSQKLGWERFDDARVPLARADLVVVLGGDGTLINAARLLGGRAVPILGINLGSLGFLTETPKGELFGAFDAVLAGQHKVDSRMKLSCRFYRDEKILIEDEVLNDVVINKGALARMADHEVAIDGQFVTHYKSDGVIVATPTGSTAYSLSAGGPIVHPLVDCTVVTPICPHALTQRPIVVPGDRVVSITLKSDSSDVYLTIDGQTGHPLRTGDRVEVLRSPNRALIVRNPALDYFAILRQKLRWGERGAGD